MHRIPRHIILVAVGLLPLLVTASASANIVIDHTSIELVPTYTQATMDAVAQSTFYFEHASVGSNIVDGLDRLHTNNPDFYQLTTSGVSSPPGPPSPGQSTNTPAAIRAGPTRSRGSPTGSMPGTSAPPSR